MTILERRILPVDSLQDLIKKACLIALADFCHFYELNLYFVGLDKVEDLGKSTEQRERLIELIVVDFESKSDFLYPSSRLEKPYTFTELKAMGREPAAQWISDIFVKEAKKSVSTEILVKTKARNTDGVTELTGLLKHVQQGFSGVVQFEDGQTIEISLFDILPACTKSDLGKSALYA